ncbi:EcoAI/FtnUII family type I restriction enzme subunit R [Deinococcus sp. SL84]|uniref:EcoAI/FtnUII family type I restriction enzme subunit R n=1 Tax=Deinococcus sp. SL84 TaxID=2994663 RepID=UPI00227350FC|nr:DEAD/DEAH box helicase family protein [Deinococcus sp. SL84]MCY1704290.1 DEAD/DEAH box helicase family protein [Deinococcus sp. SL84]
MATEADTCRTYVLPKLYAAGWTDDLIKEQRTFTDGRILVQGKHSKRGVPKRVDYLLYTKRDYPIAVVEAKAEDYSPHQGLQQAIEYAQALDLPFAYSTNGKGIVERDMLTGAEQELETFPSPGELVNRYRAFRGLPPEIEDKLLLPYHLGDRIPRYYQTIAIQRAAEAILKGQKRVLLTLATGTGKTEIAFQIAWKLWSARWNLEGLNRKPRILFLADRSVLVDDPKDKAFAPFGDARHKIEGGVVNTSREIYFSLYHSLAEDERRPGLYREFPADFFDLIIVDEAHRGSANESSSWRDILTYFGSATQLGMTATPLREDSRDTYAYFGKPVYTYSLAEGIQDGFLAPYQVRRIVTDVDATGWRPTPGMLDAHGREIPDGQYGTKDFEATLSLLPRTEAVAEHLVSYLKATDIMAKTIVFCVDQEHALQMRNALVKLLPEQVKQYPNFVARVVSDEKDVGKGYLADFQDVEKDSPVILTTSKLLSTGVDAPMVKNVVLFRVIGTMAEFKQIIGRGTRVREDYGKMFFTILDYTGTATQKFADPDFDGEPLDIDDLPIETGGIGAERPIIADPPPPVHPVTGRGSLKPDDPTEPRKLLIREGVTVKVLHEVVQELDAQGKELRTTEFTTYTAEQVRSLYMTAEELRGRWTDVRSRQDIIQALEERGIALEHLEQVMGMEDSDPFDLLCHLAFNALLKTRKQRAEDARKHKHDVFSAYGPMAQTILDQLLDQYAEHGIDELGNNVGVFKVLPATRHMNFNEVGQAFGGLQNLRQALDELPALIYA